VSARALVALLAAALTTALAAAPGATAAERPPRLQAKSAILIEATTGDVLVRKAAARERPIASATKLMTALLALEDVSLGDTFAAAAYSPAAVESKIDLRPGEHMRVRDLLRALLLESANDAAVTLAEGVSGSRSAFVRDMNRRARQLGLKHTSYANPIGLDDPDNFSSAADLVAVARRLERNPFFARTVDLPRATLRTGARDRTVINRNTLVRRVGWVDGIRTGHTNTAGYVLVGSATRDGVHVLSAVLGEPSEAARNADSEALLRYGLSRYRRATLLARDDVLARAKVRHREEDAIGLESSRRVTRVIRRGQRARVSVAAPAVLEGPLPRGARAGTATVRVGGDVVARVPLVTSRPVPEVGWPERAWRAVGRPEVLVVVLALALGGSVLIAMRRRRVRTA